MAIFGQQPWVNPFGKMSIFRLFELLDFIAQKAVLSFQNIIKEIFQANIALKKMLEKWPFLDQNHGLTHFEKYKFFNFMKFLFLQPKRRFLVLQYRKRHFPWLYCLKKQVGKMAIFGPKPWGNPFGKMAIFRRFDLLVLIALKGVFSFQNIIKDIFVAYIA